MKFLSAISIGCLKKMHISSPQTRGESNGGTWLGFERLTCVPIQTRMVKESMLTKEEKAWLKASKSRDSYHEHFFLMEWFFRTTTSDVMTEFLLFLKRTNEL